jgi:hypothetical protein
MKKLQFVFVFIVIAMTGKITLNAEIVTCKDGSQYDVLSVFKTNAIGIVVNTTVNTRGQNKAWISYMNMTPADQKRFGFDPQKFDDYVQKMAGGDKTLADDPSATPNYRTPKAIGTVTQYVIPQTTTREQYLQRQMQNNPVQGNQVSGQGVNGVSPVAGDVKVQAVAVAAPASYAGLSTQEAKASAPGAAAGISPSGVGINTPIANIGVSPYGVAVNTPVTNVGVTKDYIAVQTPIGGISLVPGPVPESVYYSVPASTVQISAGNFGSPAIVPAQIPLIGIPVVPAGAVIPPVVVYSPVITAVDCPQPVGKAIDGTIYANPVIYVGTVQQPVINYAGAFNPYMTTSGFGTFGYSANYGWSGNPWYYRGSSYGSYSGWGAPNVFGGTRAAEYTGGGWTQYSR